MRTIDLVLSTDLTKHFDILAKWETRFVNGVIDIKDEENRNIMMRMIIKFSDIANPAKEYESHKKWSRLVSQEFYMQGDEERYVFSTSLFNLMYIYNAGNVDFKYHHLWIATSKI